MTTTAPKSPLGGDEAKRSEPQNNPHPGRGEGETRFSECYENGAHPNCHRCYRGEVPNMADDSGLWVEMGAVAGGANEHGLRGWIQLTEHHPDGRAVRREYVATDSPLFAAPTTYGKGEREAVEIVEEWLAMAKETPKTQHSSLNYVPICQSEFEAIDAILRALQLGRGET